MAYFCYIESTILSVPHMEPLAATTREESREEALRLLAQHSSGIAAHVFHGEERVWTLRPGDRDDVPFIAAAARTPSGGGVEA